MYISSMKEKIILFLLIMFSSTLDAESIDSIISKARKGKAKPEFSISFNQMDSGDQVYSYKSDALLKPASNMKLVTTAAALEILGGDFEYVTRYGLLGKDLVVVGAGDPLTGDPVLAKRNGTDIFEIFRNVFNRLVSLGITEIEGDLVIDSFIFDDERFHPSWPLDQENRWYEAQVSGLNFNDNCVDILFSPTMPGEPASYKLIPDTRYLNIENKCKTVSSGKTAVGATRKHGTNDVTLIGKCRNAIKVPINVTVDRPSAYHGFILAEYLLKYGISVKGSLVIRKVTDLAGDVPVGFQELYSHKSSIIDAINESNRRSLNMVAEGLFKTVGVYSYPDMAFLSKELKRYRPGSWANGKAAVMEFMEHIGVPETDYVIDDGSGLSHENRMTANTLCSVLLEMSKSSSFDVYRASFATPEVGTLAKKRRFRKQNGKIFAKTGYISGANCLSGYCMTDTGSWLVFSIMTNSPAASNSVIDSIVESAIHQY